MSIYQEITDIANAISDIADEGKDAIKNSPISVTKSIGSISKGASKSIYYFPILMSKNIPLQTMGMISQNLEGSYMSFVRACFALTPAMNLKNSELVNVEKYLQLFHQNIGLQNKDELMISLKIPRNEAMEEWRMFPNGILNEATTNNVNDIIDRHSSSLNNFGKFGQTQRNVRLFDSNGKIVNNRVDTDHIEINAGAIEKEKDKINNMRPSVVEITVTFIIGGQKINVKIPVGVKTVIHSVNSEDLIDHIMESVAGKGILHNFIRYTTGELTSLSDILFGTSKIKNHFIKSNDVTKWADALERRRNSNKIRNNIPFLSKKPYLPNTSIVVSMEDISEIERTIGYNLLQETKRTMKFMKDNFLLSFVISDDVTETLYVMNDGDTQFSEFPFSSVKRENNKNEDIVNALIKGIGMGRTV